MAVLQLRTYSDIYTAIREELQIPSTDSTAISRIKRDINIVYQEVCAAHKWRWLKGYRDLVLPAYVNTGTVNVIQGSNQIVLSQSIASSKTGYKFSVDGFQEVYTISHHAPGSATFSLNTDFNGASSATASFHIWTDRIPLPTDCREVSEAWCDIYRQNLDTLGLQEYRRLVSLSPKNEGRPFYYYVGDYVDPTQLQIIAGLPSLLSRQSSGVIKTLVFNSSLPSSVITSMNSGDPVKWNISNAGQSSYNGDILVSSLTTTNVANDTITYTGLTAYQEPATADATLAIASITQEQSYNRYRELFLYPCLTNTNTAIHVDYVKEILPLNNDSDEPLMPVEDRVVLLYAALSRAWTRARNPEESLRNTQAYERKLTQMAGKLQGDFDKPKLLPSKMYLGSKRNQIRKRQVETCDPFPSSGGGATSATGPGNAVAVFDSNGNLAGSSAINQTILNYLTGLTSNVQAQINNLLTPSLSQGNIFVGNSSNVAASVPVTGDISLQSTGQATVVTVGGSTAANIHTAEQLANAATSANTPSTIVERDSSGNFSAGTITATLSGNATTATSATTATTATNFSGSLSGDVTGTQGATSVVKVNGASVPASKTVVGTNSSGQIVDASSATLSNNTTGTASNITATSNSTLTTLSSLSLPGSQVSGNISGNAANVTGVVPVANGGTGQTSATNAFSALAPSSPVAGQVISYNGSNWVAETIQAGSKNYITYNNFENNATTGWSLIHSALSSNVPTTVGNSGVALTTGQYVFTISSSSSSVGAVYTNNGQTFTVVNTISSGTVLICTGTGAPSASGTLAKSTGTGASAIPYTSYTLSTASTNVALSVVSSGQLAGSYSLGMTSSAASTAGDMLISQAYTIDAEDQAKVLTGKFYYSTPSGSSNANYSGSNSNSYAVYIYDVTNAQWIQPAGSWGMTQSSGIGYCTYTWQTPSNLTQFQMAIVSINATSGATTLYFDDFSVGPQTAPLGAMVTDWKSYPLTIGGTTSAPSKGTVTIDNAEYRRVGDSMEIRYDYAQTSAGTVGSGDYLFPLPSGYSIDLTKISSNPTQVVGNVGGATALSGAIGGKGWASIYNSTNLVLAVDTATNTNPSNTIIGSTSFTLNNTVAQYSFYARVPIVGWSSNVQMSSDTDTRVVGANYTGQPTGTLGASLNTITWPTKVADTHDAYNSGTYTVPVTGYYDISATASIIETITSSSATLLSLHVNGTRKYDGQVLRGLSATSLAIVPSLNVKAYPLNAGDLVTIKSYCDGSSLSYSATTTESQFSISRVSGPSVIASSESVNASYTSNNSPTIGTSFGPLAFNVKNYDSHTAYSGSTYTCSLSGKYEVSALLTLSSVTLSTTQQVELQLYKNGAFYAGMGTVLGNGSTSSYRVITAPTGVSCNAGDTLQIYAVCTVSTSLYGTAGYSHVEFKRIGN